MHCFVMALASANDCCSQLWIGLGMRSSAGGGDKAMIHELCRTYSCSLLCTCLTATHVHQPFVLHASAAAITSRYTAFPAAVLLPRCCREDTQLNCADLTCHYGLKHAYLMTVEVSKVGRATRRYAVSARVWWVGGWMGAARHIGVSWVVVLGSVQVRCSTA
jgi:hypothetical protein